MIEQDKEYSFTISRGSGHTEDYTKLGKDLDDRERDLILGELIRSNPDYQRLYDIVMFKMEQAFKDELIKGFSEVKIEEEEPSENIKEIYRRNFGKSSGF
jgi:hypothetical protein